MHLAQEIICPIFPFGEFIERCQNADACRGWTQNPKEYNIRKEPFRKVDNNILYYDIEGNQHSIKMSLYTELFQVCKKHG